MTISNGAHAVNGFNGEIIFIDNSIAMMRK